MKNIQAFLTMCFITSGIYANPIALPAIEISELYFDETGNWKLELSYFGMNQPGPTIDSVFLYSSSDTVKLPAYEYIGNTGTLVLVNDSLDSDFGIDCYSDTIKVISYSMDQPFEDVLIYGNVSGACIKHPKQGQSICKYLNVFVKDKTPTIGEPNDTSGIFGTLKGVVYDKFSNPAENKAFRLDNPFETSANGAYITRVYAKPSGFNQIYYKTGPHSAQFINIENISFNMEPDSMVEMDIYVLEDLISGIYNMNNHKNPVQVYPNPVSTGERLHVNVDLPVITSDLWLEIIDVQGKLVFRKAIIQRDNEIMMKNQSGYYILSVWMDNQKISSKRILVKNE